ncbi:MAG: 1-phosphofructokinase family hexose kinase [Chloroflexota bacterium]|nr:1-phosphofructokinase family hexose kinase [Chloroflexota bacterium]
MRCLTITLNAAVDTTYVLDRYYQGEVNRISRKMSAPGGKGNNVARVLALLGHTVRATGFIGGPTGHYIEQGLQDLGVEAAFVRVPGDSRSCLTIIERESGVISELLEPGMAISPAGAETFLRTAPLQARDVDAVVVSGSLPNGLPNNYYALLLTALHSSSALLAFDSSGEALRHGLSAKPDLIKPNAAEMASLMGSEGSPEEMAEWIHRKLIGSVLAPSAKVLLSFGEQGAVLVSQDTALLASPPAVRVVNPVGSGDALLAGYLGAISETTEESAALAEAVAVATAAALHETAGIIHWEDVRAIREDVTLHPL